MSCSNCNNKNQCDYDAAGGRQNLLMVQPQVASCQYMKKPSYQIVPSFGGIGFSQGTGYEGSSRAYTDTYTNINNAYGGDSGCCVSDRFVRKRCSGPSCSN